MPGKPEEDPLDHEHQKAGDDAKTREPPFQEPVWTYRGYRLRASEFNTAMVHLFRAEVQRANIWRQRLDTTTNWAVVTTGAAISFAFSQIDNNHIVILLNLLLVTMFLAIEARRYRYYELWSYRVRLMETDFFASMLVPPFHPSPDWAEALAENLLHPHFPISVWEAVGRRLRRNYLWVYGAIGAAWIAHLGLHPHTASTWSQFWARAQIGPIPGEIVFFATVLLYVSLIAFSLATIGLQQSAGEVLPRYGGFVGTSSSGASIFDRQWTNVRAWFRPTRHRQQLLTFIITDHAQQVTEHILKDMNRGVTSLAGTGMYTGAARAVLMCAMAVTEIPQLKALVYEVDPQAFVIVSPAQEVFGRGFSPLKGE